MSDEDHVTNDVNKPTKLDELLIQKICKGEINIKQETTSTYNGFEVGPIRPPNEAYSLLIRVTRNCPWNKCTFCPVYKGTKFSIRKIEDIKRDIDLVNKYIEILRPLVKPDGYINNLQLNKVKQNMNQAETFVLSFVLQWLQGDLKSIFIQDANSLIIKTNDLVDILNYIKKIFPWVERITSYARSDTIVNKKNDDLIALRDAGLTRIHIGLESGSDQVLQLVNKGVTKEKHIIAGIKVKEAGIELSEYIMPGLGGQKLSNIHARETADTLNQINPDFIRLRTLAIPDNVELNEKSKEGSFKLCTDIMIAKEIKLFIENLNGISSIIKSDHVLNLFQELEGVLPKDKEKMLSILSKFLNLGPEEQCRYQVGKRLGIFSSLKNMDDPYKTAKLIEFCSNNGINSKNVDIYVHETLKYLRPL